MTARWDDDGAVQHAEAKLGDAVVMMGTADHPAPEGQGLYLVVDDVDALFERATMSGAQVVYPPEDTEWGTRRCRLLDPEDYEWSLGTYRPGG